jgi:hypothetical protein
MNKLTENQIERRVERAMDSLDARLMANNLSQVEYDREVSILDKWATYHYDAIAIWPLVDSREPDPTKQGIFVYHRCWKCDDGKKPCVQGSPRNCEYPRARDD